MCTECFARGTHCREQEAPLRKHPRPLESKQNLQQRVKELETALNSIVHALKGSSNPHESEIFAAGALDQIRSDFLPPTPSSPNADSPPQSGLENAPVLSLFNNDILSRRQDDGEADAGTVTERLSQIENSVSSPKIRNIRQTLLALFPSQKRQDEILGVSDFWWDAWQDMCPCMLGPSPGMSINQFIKGLKVSGNVQKIAKALLCLAVGIQEAPVDLTSQNADIAACGELATRCLSVVDKLVLSDDELAGTIDGIECLFLMAKHDSNEGRVRRAWVTFRRAIGFAQLLGLHGRPKNLGQGGPESLRREGLWNALYITDRYFSLLLGLPYAIPEIHVGLNNDNQATPESSEGKNYVLKSASIMGRIIDRNQEPSESDTLLLTIKIDSEIMDLAASMPKEWWSLPLTPMDATKDMYYRVLPQFWHHQTRTLLHLPFMLKAATDRRYEYSRIAALESAREMIHRYRIFRPAQGFASLACKIVDFQAFTAAMILILGLLGRSQHAYTRDLQEAEEDQRLVAITTEIFHRASAETHGGVATQAARALSIISKAGENGCPASRGCSQKVVIPYFGTVVFGPGALFAGPHDQPSAAPSNPVQMPTPNEEPLDAFVQDPWDFDRFLSTPQSDFGATGVPLQQTEDPGASVDLFSNVNLDLGQDWNWFWDNTTIARGDDDLA